MLRRDCDGLTMFNLTDIGLIFDVDGAVFLALGVLDKLNNPRKVLFESSALSDCNPDLLKSNFQHIFNTLVGTVLLIFGFVGQISGNFYPEPFISPRYFALILGLLILLTALLHHWSKKFAEKQIQNLKRDKLIVGHSI